MPCKKYCSGACNNTENSYIQCVGQILEKEKVVPSPNTDCSLSILNRSLKSSSKRIVLFTGSYDKNKRVLKENDVTRTSTLPMLISINPNGYNVRIVVSNTVTDSVVQPINQLLNEEFTISSLAPDNTELGSITFKKFYINIGSITSTDFLVYDVVTQSGIYSEVRHVLIDFRADIRKIYFIGKYCKSPRS